MEGESEKKLHETIDRGIEMMEEERVRKIVAEELEKLYKKEKEVRDEKELEHRLQYMEYMIRHPPEPDIQKNLIKNKEAIETMKQTIEELGIVRLSEHQAYVEIRMNDDHKLHLHASSTDDEKWPQEVLGKYADVLKLHFQEMAKKQNLSKKEIEEAYEKLGKEILGEDEK